MARTGNKTYRIDQDVADRIDEEHEKRGIARNKLVNDMLRQGLDLLPPVQ